MLEVILDTESMPHLVFEDSSHRDLFFPLTEEQLHPLDLRCRFVQIPNLSIYAPPTESDFARLAEFLRQNPSVTLRVYGGGGAIVDLEFLRHFPFLEHFACDVYNLQSLDGLAHLPSSLKSLHIGLPTRRFSLKFVERFPSLEFLSVDGPVKDFRAILSLRNLQRLLLRSVTMPSVEPLTRLPRLWWLAVKLGGTRNLEDLRPLTGLKYLELWMIRGLESIDFISDLVRLQYLFLESLSRIDRLPSLAPLTQLRRLHIQNLRNLLNLSPVLEAKAVEELIIWESRQMQPADFEVLRGHPSLRSASISIGGPRKNEQARSILGLSEFRGMKDEFEFR